MVVQKRDTVLVPDGEQLGSVEDFELVTRLVIAES